MSSTMYTGLQLVTTVLIYPILDTFASKIYSLDVPLVVRNGTGPIHLACMYHIKDDENGLVIKWYHNADQIYQWIPPMPPQDVGVINGFAQYPKENLKHSSTRSIIHLKMVTIEMSGDYICRINTFQGGDTRKAKMIVYEPERGARIHVSSLNKTHLNVTCVANRAQPQPILKLYTEGVEVSCYYDEIVNIKRYEHTLSTRRSAIIRNSLQPMLLECEISIPQTDYKRRERIVYYPTEILSQVNRASTKHQLSVINVVFLYIILWLLVAVNK